MGRVRQIIRRLSGARRLSEPGNELALESEKHGVDFNPGFETAWIFKAVQLEYGFVKHGINSVCSMRFCASKMGCEKAIDECLD